MSGILEFHGDVKDPKTKESHHSDKQWQISIDGSTTTATYGAIGAKLRENVKVHDSAADAAAFVEKQTAAKMKKGYEYPAGGAGAAAGAGGGGDSGGDDDVVKASSADEVDAAKATKVPAVKKKAAKKGKKRAADIDADAGVDVVDDSKASTGAKRAKRAEKA
jgi:predicted DNA-binding WGR domain protein